ncbi:MAG TPA: rhomboid family intramembrane serine protease [Puia sp.]|nr:rhomboid family intramembrane serine protease [Puia sp.]
MFGLRLPPVIKNLIIINVLIYFAQYTLGRNVDLQLTNLFGLHDVHSALFRPHQLITYAFLHGNWPHVLYNMLFLWMFGSSLENHWGAKKFLIFYVVSAIGAAVVHLIVLFFEMAPLAEQLHALPIDMQQEYLTNPQFPLNMATVGASGAVFGCMAAMGFLFPNQYIYVNFLFPIKVKWYVLIYAAGELFSGIHNTAGDNVAHWAHLGGGLVGLLLVLYWNRTDRRNFY